MNCLVEPLEGRRMMSTTPPAIDISLAPAPDGKMQLTIDNAQEVKVVERIDPSTGVRSVIVDSVNAAGVLEENGPFNGVEKIVINGTSGDDVVNVDDTDIPAIISTGNGRDQISITGHAPASVFASTGALITIDSGSNKDTILVNDVDSYNIVLHGSDIIEIDSNGGL